MNRRNFLQAMSFGTGASLASGASAWAQTAPLQAAAPRRLIVVFMRGAVDGLSLVVPYNEANYYRQRSTIAIAKPGSANGVVDLDGQFGLHPALAPLMPFWKDGSLAFVHAAGSPDPTRSHFDGQDNIEIRHAGEQGDSGRLVEPAGGRRARERGDTVGTDARGQYRFAAATDIQGPKYGGHHCFGRHRRAADDPGQAERAERLSGDLP